MKLMLSVGPNPRLVRMFMAEKGLEIPFEPVDIIKGDNRQEPYLSINPYGETPALLLDDGTILTDSVAICEYLEERYPEPALIGTTPEERAITRMWVRRIDYFIVRPMAGGFRGAEGLKMFQDRVPCYPQAAADMKEEAREGLRMMNSLIGDGPFVAGDRATLADLLLFTFYIWGPLVGQPSDESLDKLQAWHKRMVDRPAGTVKWALPEPVAA